MTDATTEDTPTDDAPPDEGPPAEGPTGTRTPLLVLAVSLAVLFAVAAAVLAVIAAGDDGDDGEEALRAAAGRAGEALLTYDFNDPEAHRDRVLALSTGSFRGEYEDAFDQGLSELITRVQATSRGFVKDVFVSQIDAERGQAIVVADVTRDGAGGPRTIPDIYILLTFVEVDDGWKLDQVTDLNFAEAGTQPPATDPSASTTTSASLPVP